MIKIGLDVARSRTVKSMAEAQAAAETLGISADIRPSFTLGGAGGGIAYNGKSSTASSPTARSFAGA